MAMSEIPKIIHYCWFGGNPLPVEYQRYIASWRKYMPDYEIVEWNEQNYDVNCIPFSTEAYKNRKLAFVSDYARLRILYENGGVYFDTDVELLKPLDDILSRGGFMGFEKNTNAPAGKMLMVNPGLGFAVPPHHPLIREMMEFYETHHLHYPERHLLTICIVVTEVLKKRGLKQSESPTEIQGITIYPWEYFCPSEFMGYSTDISENTYSIHHYSASWMSWKDKLRMFRIYCITKVMRLLKLR